MQGVIARATFVKDFSLDAVGITKATKAIIARFCTPMLDPPYCHSPPATSPDEQLQMHIRQITEVFDADAAADEQLAGQMLAGVPDTGEEEPYLSNVRVQNRDKAHGARRTLFITMF